MGASDIRSAHLRVPWSKVRGGRARRLVNPAYDGDGGLHDRSARVVLDAGTKSSSSGPRLYVRPWHATTSNSLETIMKRLGTALMAAALVSAGAWTHAGEMAHGKMDRGVGAQGTADTRGATGAVGHGIGAASDASKIQGQVPAVAGGVGLNARDALRADAPPHNVKMVFTLDTGSYLADVDVKVTDSSGKTVIDGVSDGPWLYAQLPAGRYTADASYGGKTMTKRFSVNKSGQMTTYFRWPASVEQRAGDNMDQILRTGPQTAGR
jgi:hypothetical protein